MTKLMTLQQLIDESGCNAFVYCDAGNGSAFGTAGQLIDYNDDAAAKYGALEMRQTMPHMSDDHVECVYASDWIEGKNGYSYQVRF